MHGPTPRSLPLWLGIDYGGGVDEHSNKGGRLSPPHLKRRDIRESPEPPLPRAASAITGWQGNVRRNLFHPVG